MLMCHPVVYLRTIGAVMSSHAPHFINTSPPKGRKEIWHSRQLAGKDDFVQVVAFALSL